MIVYFNYPNSQITIHHDNQCNAIKMHQKSGQRIITATMQTLPQLISDLIAEQYRFASNSASNDLYIDLVLGTPEQSETLIPFIQALMSQNYGRFAQAVITSHC